MSSAPDPLLIPLAQGRRRLRARAALTVALAALVTGSLVWVGAEGAERARQLGRLSLEHPVPIWRLSLGGAVLTAAVVALAEHRRRPTGDGALALVIDRRAGLGLAYATAVEAARRPAQGRVAPLLLSDLRREAAELDLRQFLPLWARPMSVALAACLLAVAVALALHITLPAPGVTALLPEPPPAEETRTRARDLVERLLREAELRQNPMLAAIGRAMAERVAEAPPEADDRLLNEELGALTDQARAAFGASPPAWLAPPGAGANLPGRGGMGAQTPNAKPEGEDTFAVDFNELDRARRAQAALRAAEELGPDTGASGPQNAASRGGEAPAGSSIPPQRIDPAALQAAGRETVGAALDSGRGPADQAGAGSRSLDGEALSERAAEGDTAMPLPEAAQDRGRRIRITLPPPAGGSATASQVTAGQGAGPGSHQTVERAPLSADSRAAVGRYFERSGP
ncbi:MULTISPECIES: hypothetical protein [unclassified Haematobacter]|uniref:hypothetical protein n=1 Tax=unclassified Haematobacter TaxID=2640585 RepID=UPI0025B7BEF3|nr:MULTISPECIES: hypothetical protein [unclassified Haematobacter]